MDLSTGTLIGPLIGLALMVALVVLVLSATRRLNRKLAALEGDVDQGQGETRSSG